MGGIIRNRSVEFFDTQFQRQIRESDFRLNPFEERALAHLKGEILDLGCGLGNLSLEAARRGHRVLAVDASSAAVARINAQARQEALPVRALLEDVGKMKFDRAYDTIVAIGLLMFFERGQALALLRSIQDHVRPGGRCIVNVLIQGTTYMGMFDPESCCLFETDELAEKFAGWTLLDSRAETFPAPEGTCKAFSTVIAEKASVPAGGV